MDKQAELDDMFSESSPLCNLKEGIDKMANDQPDPTHEGFAHVWSQILKTAADHGFEAATRRVSRMEKRAGHGGFHEGMMKAAGLATTLQEMPEVRGWYDFVKEAYDQSESQDELMKFAAAVADQPTDDFSRREMGYWGGAAALEEREDLVDIAWNGPSIIMRG